MAAIPVLLTVIAVSDALGQVAARPAAEAPQWFVGVAGAAMNPLHGDDEPEGGVVLASFGFTDNRRFRIEAEVSRRAHSSSHVDGDVFLFGGANGIHGRAERIEGGRETTDWTVGVNVFGRTGGRTVSVFGGPGIVLHREELRSYRRVTNCTPPIPSSGGECLSFDNRSSSQGVGLQFMAGVDFVLHRRLTAFVAGRGEYRSGLAMGGVGVVAGMRIGVK